MRANQRIKRNDHPFDLRIHVVFFCFSLITSKIKNPNKLDLAALATKS